MKHNELYHKLSAPNVIFKNKYSLVPSAIYYIVVFELKYIDLIHVIRVMNGIINLLNEGTYPM